MWPMTNDEMTRFLLRLFMAGVLAAEAAELAELEPFRRLLFVLRRAVVPPLTLQARERDYISHNRPVGVDLPAPDGGT
jgi:hypothetical protein